MLLAILAVRAGKFTTKQTEQQLTYLLETVCMFYASIYQKIIKRARLECVWA
jgi:hypothetical protein